MTRPARSIGEALRDRAARDGNSPLLTWYGLGGERTELSAASFENWVAKTVNLLAESGVEPGATVRLDVLREHPAHWMALVWPLAVWDAGAGVDQATASPDLVVTGPAVSASAGGVPGFACSLDAWARPLSQPHGGLLDYTGEALAQPDASLPERLAPGAIAWADTDAWTEADLLATEPVGDRVLARPSDAQGALRLLLGAILGGGSVVLVEHDDPATQERLATAERARLLT